MDDSYSIMLIGLSPAESSFAGNHILRLGHEVLVARDLAEAREKPGSQRTDLVYLQTPADEAGLAGIEEVAGSYPSAPVVLVCARPAESFIVNAWRAGAADILFLPLTAQSLDGSLRRSVRKLRPRPLGGVTPLPARFSYFDDAGKQCSAAVHPPRFRIGRGSGNDLMLNHMGVSRAHAEVVIRDGEYLLRDVGSKLGTYLNGARIEQAELNGGDYVQLGGLQGMKLTFHTGDILQSLISGSDSKSEIGLSIRGFRDVGKLFAAFRALSSISVLDDLLALVVDTAVELTGAERGFIMLKEPNGDLSFRCARNNQKRPLDGACFKTSRRVPHDVYRTGRPVVINDLGLGEADESHHFTRQLGLRSISCVPLRYLTLHESRGSSAAEHAETIGVLYVDSQGVSSGMSNTRVDALQTLASEAAMAIYNARLYKDSQDKRRMDEQLATAREIQQALLPKPNRDLGYARACGQCLPCYEIGGDYFDYFDLDDGRFGFAVGDVAGKGMPAALLASLIQGLISAQTAFNPPISSIIGNLNRNLVQRGTGNRFVTFFFGILDPDGNCTYINAGHNPPLLLRRDGSMMELTAGGMVLGLFAGAPYETETIKLAPGDHLVIFTDGVIEALNKAGDEFGLERLVEMLRLNVKSTAEEIQSRLQDAVISFSADAPQHDDITMMVLGFREAGD